MPSDKVVARVYQHCVYTESKKEFDADEIQCIRNVGAKIKEAELIY